MTLTPQNQNRALAFAIRGEFIPLDHLLKATGLVGSGGAAHAEVDLGKVTVDGQVEIRRRAKLRPGQRVEYGGQVVELTAGGSLDSETAS